MNIKIILCFYLLSSQIFAKPALNKNEIKKSTKKENEKIKKTLPVYSIQIIKKSSLVKFKAKGNPGFLKVDGEAKENLTAKLSLSSDNKLSGIFKFPMKDLKTGIRLRDKHMKKRYLEVKKYPEAILEIKELFLPKKFITNPDIKKLPFVGFLTIHGQRVQTNGEVKVEKKNNQIKVTARTTTTLDAHKIKTPGYMGITLADKVNIEVSFLVQIKKTK